MWRLPLECAVTAARLEELALIRRVEKLRLDSDLGIDAIKPSQSDMLVEPRVDSPRTCFSEATVMEDSLVRRHTKRYSHSRNDSLGGNSSSDEQKGDSSMEESRSGSLLGGEIDPEDEDLTNLEVGFDLDKCVCCTVENGNTLVHSIAGKGYGVASAPISSGCYTWKVTAEGC